MKTLKQLLNELTMECQDPDNCTIYNKTKTCPTYCQTDVLATVKEWLTQKRQDLLKQMNNAVNEDSETDWLLMNENKLFIDELLEELSQP